MMLARFESVEALLHARCTQSLVFYFNRMAIFFFGCRGDAFFLVAVPSSGQFFSELSLFVYFLHFCDML
jgi:hypothetical protein